MNTQRLLVVAGIIALAIMSRFFPHPSNFTPIGAVALFAGATLRNKWAAFLLPISILFLSDCIFQLMGQEGFYSGMWVTYLSFALVVGIGMFMQNRITKANVLVGSLLGSVVFYLITNFAYFYPSTYYPHNFNGIMASYTGALPFFRNMLAGDLFYNAILFSGFALLERKYSFLRFEI